MRVLFLGGNKGRCIADWLIRQGEEVVYSEDKIHFERVLMLNPEIIVSYNYKYILNKKILNLMKGRSINLHISYLPYNRGADPNIWSFLENTPKGVTIHYIDAGIDTGDIIIQKQVWIDEEKETLKSSYDILHYEIQELFKKNWGEIAAFEIDPSPQHGEATSHSLSDRVFFEPLLLKKGWDTPVRGLRKKFLQMAEKRQSNCPNGIH